MIAIRKLGILGMLVLSSLPSAVQGGPMFVKLIVKHDGQEKPAPDHVTLSFDDHSLQIPVREGKFEVPSEVLHAQEVAFAADIGVDRIQVTGIPGRKLVRATWTLILAECAYGDDYQWVVPKDAEIRSSCILAFDPDEGEGTAVFVAHCRSKSE